MRKYGLFENGFPLMELQGLEEKRMRLWTLLCLELLSASASRPEHNEMTREQNS